MTNKDIDLVGIEYLRRFLASKKRRVDLRYKYYDQKKIAESMLISAPIKLQQFMASSGWCAKAVDSIADRVMYLGIDEATDAYGMNELFEMNNSEVLFDSAILSALITSCSFIYISNGADGPQMQVIDGGSATGIIDPLTGMLKEGYAILDVDEYGKPILEAYFTPDFTQYIRANGEVEEASNPAPYPLLVPIPYRPDNRRPFGHSRITRAMMDIQDASARTFLDACIASGAAAFPQKWITGLADDVEISANWEMAISKIWAFYKDEEGDSPNLGQFPQIQLTPYSDHLRMCAGRFAGESDLTIDDLGFVGANPSSMDAMRIAHENLRLRCRKFQRTAGTGFKNAGYLAACLRDNTAYTRQGFNRVRNVWEPIFEPDPSTLSAIGDGISKLNVAVPGFVSNQTVSEMTGIRPQEG